jgi:hypothetical protein
MLQHKRHFFERSRFQTLRIARLDCPTHQPPDPAIIIDHQELWAAFRLGLDTTIRGLTAENAGKHPEQVRAHINQTYLRERTASSAKTRRLCRQKIARAV